MAEAVNRWGDLALASASGRRSLERMLSPLAGSPLEVVHLGPFSIGGQSYWLR